MAPQPETSLSRGLGVYYATAFNRWQLKIVGGPYSTGAQTYSLASGSANLRDGTGIVPFTVNGPVAIGNGSDLETINVTAFANVFPNSNTETVSMTAANIHGQGETIQSGTAGLLEAAAFANSQGGGTVVVDPIWAAQGGTSANIATVRALFPAIIIQDNRSGAGDVLTTQVTLSSAQLLALQTTAVTVIPAPGTGELVVPLGFTLDYKFNTTAYTIANADNAFQLEYVGKSTNIVKTNATGTVDQTSSDNITVAPAVAGTVFTQANSAGLGVEVKLVGTTPALTLGDGTVTLFIRYQVVPLS